MDADLAAQRGLPVLGWFRGFATAGRSLVLERCFGQGDDSALVERLAAEQGPAAAGQGGGQVERHRQQVAGRHARQPWFVTLDRVFGRAAKALGARVGFVDVASIIDMPAIVKRLARERCDAAIVTDFPPFRPHMALIAALLRECRHEERPAAWP